MTDPTEPIPATETCPRGHFVATEQIVVRDGQKVCPVCEAEAPWATLPTKRPVFWSRHQLRLPLIAAAVALFGWGIGGAFGIAAAAAQLSHDYPGATANLIGSIFGALALFALAAAVGWIAYLVGLDDRPR